MICASGRSSSTPTIRQAESVVAHFWTDEADLELAPLGATSGIDRFEDTSLWDRLSTGETRFHRPWLRGRMVEVIQVNGSFVAIAEILEAGGRNTTDA